MNILELKNLGYSYEKNSRKVLNDINLDFETGKIYAIVGKSGAGKTTLLSILSGLAKPTEGQILYNGKDIAKLDKYKYRSRHVGVIFQSFNLLFNLSAIENVQLSMDIAGVKAKNKKLTATQFLKKVQLEEEELDRKVLLLSGGQQQRVAIARALSYNPQIILADEPTGNLDTETQSEIMNIFKMLASEGKCVIIVTHSPEVAAAADVVYELQRTKK